VVVGLSGRGLAQRHKNRMTPLLLIFLRMAQQRLCCLFPSLTVLLLPFIHRVSVYLLGPELNVGIKKQIDKQMNRTKVQKQTQIQSNVFNKALKQCQQRKEKCTSIMVVGWLCKRK
jgi:hypothetical protein